MSAMFQPAEATPAAAPLLSLSGRSSLARAVEEVMARVQSGGVAACEALDLLAGLSRSADTALADLKTVARAIAVLRDAGEVGDREVVRALAGQCLVAAMLIDAVDPAGSSGIFSQILREHVLCERVSAVGPCGLEIVSAVVLDAATKGRGELRLDQAVAALATFAQLGRPACLEEAALALVRLPLSERTVIQILRQIVLSGPAEHRLSTGALLLTFARGRAMSDARMLAALAHPDPGAAVRLLVALLGQNDAATANPSRPPLGWDVIAVGLHWLVAEGVCAERLIAAVAAEAAALPDDLSTMLSGMAQRIAAPKAGPAFAPLALAGS